MADDTVEYQAQVTHRTDGWHWEAQVKTGKNRQWVAIGEGLAAGEENAVRQAQRSVDAHKHERAAVEAATKTVPLS